jgi:hypothetical protein
LALRDHGEFDFRIADPPQPVESLLGAGHNLFRFSNLGVQRCPCAVRVVAGCMLIQNMSLSPRAQDRRRAVSAV